VVVATDHTVQLPITSSSISDFEEEEDLLDPHPTLHPMALHDRFADRYLLVSVNSRSEQPFSRIAADRTVNGSEQHLECIRKAFHVTGRVINKRSDLRTERRGSTKSNLVGNVSMTK
jgi:hypothetical protein